MADDFRTMQRRYAHDGSSNGGGGCYGCPCCRPISNLNIFKKFARKKARRLLRNKDKATLFDDASVDTE